MPSFSYKARDSEGKLVTGRLEAESQRAVVDVLDGRGLLAVDVRPAEPLQGRALLARRRGVSLGELVQTFRSLADLVRAGVPLSRALAILHRQSKRPALQQLLGDFAAGASALNKTSQAIVDGLGGEPRPVRDEVPFSSARKWSALAFDDGVYVLGAYEMLQAQLEMDDAARSKLEEWSDQGLRVLVFAGNATVSTLHDESDQPVLPPLTLLGVVSFSDELRPHLDETLSAFTDNGVKLKVISGDNPQTVAEVTNLDPAETKRSDQTGPNQ